MPGHVHIVGAGVAGLSAAIRLLDAGRAVTVYEAAGQAGGRCRSFHDQALDCTIDNGNHLLLSGNTAALDYLDAVGARDELFGPERPEFPFIDLGSGERWVVRPSAGRIPWWLFDAQRRVPGTRLIEYLRAVRLATADRRATVAECLDGPGPLFRRFWEPLAVAALNTAAEEGAAQILWPVVRECFGRGGRFCRPLIARRGLSAAFVDPAAARLAAAGAPVRLNCRLRELVFDGGRVAALGVSGHERIPLGADDSVVLAVPPAGAGPLVPGLAVPQESRAIVNGHFRLPPPNKEVSFVGLLNGTCQWLFVRGDVVSTTVSAADDLAEEDADRIARRMWREVRLALGLGGEALPPHRILKEKRATFAQTPDEAQRRPGAATRWRNLFLAGDWTDTGLPATIEGSVRSGHTAAAALVAGAANT